MPLFDSPPVALWEPVHGRLSSVTLRAQFP